MILRALLVCFLSLMVLTNCIKKKPLEARRPPIGNDFFLTQDPTLPDSPNDQGSASIEKEYYDFNPYNEQVKFYQEPAPKEVFAHHKDQNTFNMQKHLQQQKNGMEVKEEINKEQSVPTEKETTTTDTQKTTPPEQKKVVIKPRKKMGLVKVIPKNTISTTPPSTIKNPSLSNSGDTAPIQPITFPKKGSDSISLEDAMKYIAQDTSQNTNTTSQNNAADSTTNTKPNHTNTTSQNNAADSTTNTKPNQMNTTPQSPSNAPTPSQEPQQQAPSLDNTPENRPIPLPFS